MENKNNLKEIKKEAIGIVKESWHMYWLPLTWTCKKIKSMFK